MTIIGVTLLSGGKISEFGGNACAGGQHTPPYAHFTQILSKLQQPIHFIIFIFPETTSIESVRIFLSHMPLCTYQLRMWTPLKYQDLDQVIRHSRETPKTLTDVKTKMASDGKLIGVLEKRRL